MLTQEQKQDAQNQLSEIVNDFNGLFKQWEQKTGCVANFGWDYKNGKVLEIISIDAPVYRKTPITPERISPRD